MQVSFLKEVVASVCGPQAVQVADILALKKNVNEFNIAEKLKLTINQTRNILYKLADKGLVSFIRKKDSRKGGWYTYYWTINSEKALEILKQRLEVNLVSAEQELAQRKQQRFYHSPSAGIEYTEEQALEHGFVCPETGEVMQLKDMSSLLIEIEKKVVKIRESLNEVDKELLEIRAHEEKLRERKYKSEIKKKAKESAAKNAVRKKEREKAKAIANKGKKDSGKDKKVKKNKKASKKDKAKSSKKVKSRK